jgi:hypothetical protein
MRLSLDKSQSRQQSKTGEKSVSWDLNYRGGAEQSMTYPGAMRDYYSGQRYVALVGALVAILYLVLAMLTYARKAHPARAFAITAFLIAGLLMLPVNVAYFAYIGPTSARASSTLAQSQSGFEDAEATHVNNMMNGFHRSYRLDSTVARSRKPLESVLL